MTSTSSAVDRAKEESNAAAVASYLAAEQRGLPGVVEGIQDKKENVTRFLVKGAKAPARREDVN